MRCQLVAGSSYSRLVRIWPCPSYAQADAALLRNAFLGSMLALALYKGAVAGHTLLLTTVQFGSAWVWFGGRLAVAL